MISIPYRLTEARIAMEALAANPDDTAQAIRAIGAMSGKSPERCFQRFARSEGGARILREQRELFDVLSDIDGLGAMPEGSLGRAIHEFYTVEELSAAGLKGASEEATGKQGFFAGDDDRARFARRLRELHDVFHVLTGYGRDMRGEIACLAFTYSQTKNTGIGYVALKVLRGAGWSSEMGRVIRQAYWRGRRAAWLIDQDWEALMHWPLAQLREELGVGSAPEYEQLRSAGAPALVN
jgi:ubiquinone biosynthesis protein COQ4